MIVNTIPQAWATLLSKTARGAKRGGRGMIVTEIEDGERQMLIRAVMLRLETATGREARTWATLLSKISGTDTVLTARRAYPPADYRAGEPDTSDIPEAGEDWFKRAARRRAEREGGR